MLLCLFLYFSFILETVRAWTSTPFTPAAYPLAVRTPYLSAWLAQGGGPTALNDGWPIFWTGSLLGWQGFVKVDGNPYSFLGAISTNVTKAVQKSATFTTTQSIFVLSAGPVDVTVTFLSPVEADNLFELSLPFSYMAVKAASTDGASHSVQIYSDITAEWVSGDDSLQATWTTTTGGILTHQVQLANPSVFAEVNGHSQYGSAFYSILNAPGTTFQTGPAGDVRGQFANEGLLANTSDTNFRAISDNWPVFAFSRDLGTILTSADPIIFTIGHIRDPAIQYIVANGALQPRSLYFWSQVSTAADAISHVVGNFDNALNTANALDAKVQNDASKISANYTGNVALSIIQAIAATELTISKNGDGSWNTTDVLLFMKEVSSDGNVNAVDVIYSAWPAFLYLNPALGKPLLDGLFKYQATRQYPEQWSVHDLGSTYPQALGHNDGKDQSAPVEDSGNMLIMALSYAQMTGDLSQLQQNAGLLDQWTQVLIADSLTSGQANIVIKGNIGIQVMSQIASLLGNSAKSANYSGIAASFVAQL